MELDRYNSYELNAQMQLYSTIKNKVSNIFVIDPTQTKLNSFPRFSSSSPL